MHHLSEIRFKSPPHFTPSPGNCPIQFMFQDFFIVSVIFSDFPSCCPHVQPHFWLQKHVKTRRFNTMAFGASGSEQMSLSSKVSVSAASSLVERHRQFFVEMMSGVMVRDMGTTMVIVLNDHSHFVIFLIMVMYKKNGSI